MWLRGVRGRGGVTAVKLPRADHLFPDGTGRPTPVEYNQPGHLDRAGMTTIATWTDHRR